MNSLRESGEEDKLYSAVGVWLGVWLPVLRYRCTVLLHIIICLRLFKAVNTSQVGRLLAEFIENNILYLLLKG